MNPEGSGVPGLLVLTPRLFHRLDSLARREGGLPLAVVEPGRLPGGWYAQSGIGLELVVRAGHPEKVTRPAILLVNRLDPGAWYRTPRPELDWRAVPKDFIYEFIVRHEVGHHLLDPLPMETGGLDAPPFFRTARGRCLAGVLAERRADRFAWEGLYPGRPPALLPCPMAPLPSREELDRLEEAHPGLFRRPPRSVEPLTDQPGRMIPVRHLDPGIPWAGEGTAGRGPEIWLGGPGE